MDYHFTFCKKKEKKIWGHRANYLSGGPKSYVHYEATLPPPPPPPPSMRQKIKFAFHQILLISLLEQWPKCIRLKLT